MTGTAVTDLFTDRATQTGERRMGEPGEGRPLGLRPGMHRHRRVGQRSMVFQSRDA